MTDETQLKEQFEKEYKRIFGKERMPQCQKYQKLFSLWTSAFMQGYGRGILKKWTESSCKPQESYKCKASSPKRSLVR